MWSWLPFWGVGLAEVVDRNVECSEEGVHIEHEESAPFPWGLGGKPTLEQFSKRMVPLVETRRVLSLLY